MEIAQNAFSAAKVITDANFKHHLTIGRFNVADKYLAKDMRGETFIFKVSRETKCFYFVRFNEVFEEKIPKKTMRTGSGYYTQYWRIATEEDIKKFKFDRLLNKVVKDLQSEKASKLSFDDLYKLDLLLNK